MLYPLCRVLQDQAVEKLMFSFAKQFGREQLIRHGEGSTVFQSPRSLQSSGVLHRSEVSEAAGRASENACSITVRCGRARVGVSARRKAF
ncbi:hypothetical protein [Lysobacter capsici]|uniref:hypothetical protein n=1 Tax=Lysobacter capsici TaxID=435897 RepID=UPI001C000654|nr:hypothetical protein [Lysobacter capsici]QWF16965.1 hypothetical protein KME82_25080 [Lysobacter capsici]